MAEKNKKKQIKLSKTAAGAQQYINIDPSKDTFDQIQSKIKKAKDKVSSDRRKLSYDEFLKKYGRSVSEIRMMLDDQQNAALSKFYKEKYGDSDSIAKMYDKNETEGREFLKKAEQARKDYQKKAKGSTDYRKGGMVLFSKDNRKKK